MELGELNLENPIFVFYLNIEGRTRQSVDELVKNYKKNLGFTNITTWVIPCEFTKVECVWHPNQKKSNLIVKLEGLFSKLGDDYQISNLKADIRDLLLSEMNI